MQHKQDDAKVVDITSASEFFGLEGLACHAGHKVAHPGLSFTVFYKLLNGNGIRKIKGW